LEFGNDKTPEVGQSLKLDATGLMHRRDGNGLVKPTETEKQLGYILLDLKLISGASIPAHTVLTEVW
jgi:hypothetical protein